MKELETFVSVTSTGAATEASPVTSSGCGCSSHDGGKGGCACAEAAGTESTACLCAENPSAAVSGCGCSSSGASHGGSAGVQLKAYDPFAAQGVAPFSGKEASAPKPLGTTLKMAPEKFAQENSAPITSAPITSAPEKSASAKSTSGESACCCTPTQKPELRPLELAVPAASKGGSCCSEQPAASACCSSPDPFMAQFSRDTASPDAEPC